jgi:hypothetical protein
MHSESSIRTGVGLIAVKGFDATGIDTVLPAAAVRKCYGRLNRCVFRAGLVRAHSRSSLKIHPTFR